MISAWLFYCIMKRVVFWKANSVLSVSSFRLFSRKVLSDLLELITVKFLFLSWFISESKELSRIFNMLSCLKLSKIKVWQVPRLFRRGGFLLGTTTFNYLLLLAPFSFLFVVLFQTCLRFRWPYILKICMTFTYKKALSSLLQIWKPNIIFMALWKLNAWMLYRSYNLILTD